MAHVRAVNARRLPRARHYVTVLYCCNWIFRRYYLKLVKRSFEFQYRVVKVLYDFNNFILFQRKINTKEYEYRRKLWWRLLACERVTYPDFSKIYTLKSTRCKLSKIKKFTSLLGASIFKLAQFQLRKSHISSHLLQPIFFGNCLEAFICK